MKDYDGFIIDLDGTIYVGAQPIPGAAEAIVSLLSSGKRVVFTTNNPVKTPRAHALTLRRMGIPVQPDDVVNTLSVLSGFLERQSPGATIYVIGEKALCRHLSRRGFRVVTSPGPGQAVEYVVVSYDRQFNIRKLEWALWFARQGAKFVGTNRDATKPAYGGETPDTGGIVAAVETVIGRELDLVVGKPSLLMLESTQRRMGLPLERCLIVGDRMETDIAMGWQHGVPTALVLTGVTDLDRLRRSPVKPDHVLDSVADLNHASPPWR